MRLTSFLRLKKPEGSDVVNVEDLNDNMDALDGAIEELQTRTGDVSNGLVHMEQAATRTNVANGDTLAILFGKVMKWFADLQNGAFADIANNDTTATSGYVADARIARTLGLEIDGLDTRVTTLETSFPDGCRVIADAITAEGVSTASNASPSTMAANIARIREDGSLSETKYAPTGTTWWAGKQKYTGTGTDRGEVTLTPSGNNTVTSPAGYYSRVIADGRAAYGAGYAAAQIASIKGNATQADVINGVTFTSETEGVNKTGTLPDYRGANVRSISLAGQTGSQDIALPNGAHDHVIVDGSQAYNAGHDARQLRRVLVDTLDGSFNTGGQASYTIPYSVPGVTLTSDNFYLVPITVGGSGGNPAQEWGTAVTSPTVNYANGNIVVSDLRKTGTYGARVQISTAELYCVYIDP